VLAIVAAMLTLCGARSEASSFDTPSTTSWPAWCPGAADSMYDSADQSSNVTQQFDGSIKGCFRVPDDRSPTLHVAWQAFVQLDSGSSGPTTTNDVSNSSSDGDFKLSLSTTNVHPGERVTLFGRYITGRRPANSSNQSGIVCWDGCQTGIQIQDNNLVWISGKEFRTSFNVPDAPWFESNDGKASVHELSSGTYPVGIECITVSSGCATQAADAQIDANLIAPRATWCSSTVPCGSLHVNSVHTSVGDVIEVRGQAPLVGVIGRPFGYWLEYSASGFGNTVVSFHSPVTTETTASIAPRTLDVTTGATWASQDFANVVASSWASIFPETPTASGHSIAVCDAHAIVVTGNGPPLTVPTTSVGAVLVLHHLNVNGSKSAGACASAYVDPSNPTHVFATFYTAQHGSIPPSFLAGLDTTNDGVTWSLIPSPPGHTSYNFGGFRQDGTGVAAVFMNNSNVSGFIATKTTIATEVTTNGGASWRQSTLNCPNGGPCVIFGPSSPGNCAMNGQAEAVYFGTRNEYRGGAIFEESRWITDVNACYSQQLAGTRSGTELLLDPSSVFPLVASSDGGRIWYNVQIPRLAGLGAGDQSSWLLIDQEGTLLATTSSAKGATSLYLLTPHATAWCRSLALTKNFSTYVSPLRTTGDDVFWSVTRNNESTVGPPSMVHVVAAASLRCQ
jgi:hypothetical protein